MPDSVRTMLLITGGCVLLLGFCLFAKELPMPVNVVASLGLVAAGAAVRRLIDRPAEQRQQWRRQGLCERCGYDPRGNASGVCPECGATAAAAQAL